jgi:Putative metallopeptidase
MRQCPQNHRSNDGFTKKLAAPVMRRALAALFGIVLLLSGPVMAEDTGEPEEAGVAFANVIDRAVEAWQEPEDSTATEDDIRGRATYVVGNVAWFLYHEFGHALVSEYNLPILGKEEDSVDLFATLTMVIDANDAVLDNMISEVVRAWFDGGLYTNINWGQHSVNEQRGYAVICMLVGHDPEGYAQFATDAEMPPERQASCKWDFEKADAAWKSQLEPYRLSEGDEPTIELPVVYGDAGNHPEAEAFLQASGVLEAVASQIRQTFNISTPIFISAEACGQANAFWKSGEEKVVICYELIDFFIQRAKIADNEESDGDADAE